MRMHPLLMGGASLGLPRNGLVLLADPYRDAYGLDAAGRAALQTGVDYSGRGNTLTFGATTGASTDDPLNTGTAWSFDGGDYMQGANAATLNGGRYSVLAVVKGPSVAVTSAIVDKTNGGTGSGAGWGVITRSSNPYLAIYAYGTSLHRTNGTVANVLDGNTHVVGGSIASGTQGLYVDGVKVLADTQTYDETKITNVGQLFLGAQHVDGTTPTAQLPNGSFLHFVGVWNRVLTDAEFSRAYRYLKSLMARRGVTLA